MQFITVASAHSVGYCWSAHSSEQILQLCFSVSVPVLFSPVSGYGLKTIVTFQRTEFQINMLEVHDVTAMLILFLNVCCVLPWYKCVRKAKLHGANILIKKKQSETIVPPTLTSEVFGPNNMDSRCGWPYSSVV